MFDHRGDTIQWWAISFFVTGAILCLGLGALLIIANITLLTTASVILIFVCVLLAFVVLSLISLLLYAIGQVVENSEKSNDLAEKQIEETEKTNELLKLLLAGNKNNSLK